MSTLHPLFAGILATCGMPQSGDVSALRRAQYVSDLRRMDWQFEHSDDHQVWRRGRDELVRLRAEQAEIDPDGALWRANANPDFPPNTVKESSR